MRIHDLRRTIASWLVQSGYSEYGVKQLLNHSTQGVTGVYARMRPEAARHAVEDVGRQIVDAINADDNIISLSTMRG